MSSDTALTVIFDTDCVLCSAFVHFILKHEREPTTRFVSAWSDIGAVLASEHGLTTADLDRTYLVIDGQRGLTQSDAGLAIMRRLCLLPCRPPPLRHPHDLNCSGGLGIGR